MSGKILSIGLVSFLVLTIWVGCNQNNKKTNSDTSQEVATMNLKKVTLDVQGMTCSGCEYNVESALKKVDGVAKAKADYSNGKAEVEFDPEIATVEQLVEAVNKSGYSANAAQIN